MKIVVWAYPTTAIVVQLVNNFGDDFPIEEEHVFMQDLMLTINNIVELNSVDEILFLGPASFANRFVERAADMFPNLKVSLEGENDD